MLTISNEVASALKNAEPVVALESTLITHGLPFPSNVETAIAAEEYVRREGAIPATIAVMEGHIRVGLSHDEIGFLGRLERKNVMKVSRGDLGVAVAQKGFGATTVASTMICAKLAGIQVFATGGLGGVHRGGENSLDISADLMELGRTPVVVVCAGAKSILDIGRTLEVLETQGVPVVGYQTKKFPAFHYRDTVFDLHASVDHVEELARMIEAHFQLINCGFLVANPIREEDAMNHVEVEQFIAQAVREAEDKRITGKAVTPFLLSRLNELSGGKSLASNVALIKNNAALAAQIAKQLASPRGFEPRLPP